MSKPTMQELMKWLRGYRYYDKDTRDMIASRVEAVLNLHDPKKSVYEACGACGDYMPCATLRVLNGEKP